MFGDYFLLLLAVVFVVGGLLNLFRTDEIIWLFENRYRNLLFLGKFAGSGLIRIVGGIWLLIGIAIFIIWLLEGITVVGTEKVLWNDQKQ